jgi:WD40 repeat protein
VTDLALSPDGTTVASSNFNGAVLLTAIDTGQTDVLLPAGDTGRLGAFEWMTTVGFTPDGAALYAGSREGKLRRWSLPSGGVSSVVDLGTNSEIADLAVSPDGTRLAVVVDGTVRWLDIATGAWLDEPSIDVTGGLVFAPGGAQLAYSSSGGLAVRDLDSGGLVGEPWKPAASSYGAVAWGGPGDDPVLAMTDENGATWWRAGGDRLVRAACERANRMLDAEERVRFLLDPARSPGACAT